MTTLLRQKKTPTIDSKGLIAKLLDYEPVTRQALAEDKVLTKLYDLEHHLGQSLNLDNKLLYLNDNLTITSGSDAGLILPTADTIGLVLQDNKQKPVSLASITPNSDKSPVITDTSQPCAFIIGDMSSDSQLWAVDDLDYGVELYHNLSVFNKQPVTVIVNMINWLFIPVVKHFSEIQTVYINTTIDKKENFELLAGSNVKAVVTTFDLLMELQQGKPLDEVMADATVNDLQIEKWAEPEPLANDPSTPTPYPIDAFKDLSKKVVQKIAYYAQVPEAMAGQCFLGALSHMGQRFIDAPIGHMHMPASLYLITEGESGSGKSVAMRLSHFEIRGYEKEHYQTYINQLGQWESSKDALQGKERKEFLANEPKPFNPITLFGDATIEPILDKFINREMGNASWTTDEAGQFFSGHTMQGDTAGNALSALTTLWSDGSINRLRSQKYNITCLAQRVHELRNAGVNIDSELVTQDSKTFSVYWITDKITDEAQAALTQLMTEGA